MISDTLYIPTQMVSEMAATEDTEPLCYFITLKVFFESLSRYKLGSELLILYFVDVSNIWSEFISQGYVVEVRPKITIEV